MPGESNFASVLSVVGGFDICREGQRHIAMTAFLRDTEDFLARLPSINLDGMESMHPGGEALKAGLLPSDARIAQVVGGEPMLLDPKHACTITTGPAPYAEKRLPLDYLPGGDGKSARPSSSTYSPSCTLYPLTSLESYSNGGHSAELDASLGGACGSGATGSAESDAAEEHGLRRSTRNPGARKDKAPKEKRKVGRPIAYCGEPDSPDLTPAERRRIKRRIANRESARRVRARRQEQIEEMAVKAQEMERHNMQLATHASSVETQHGAISAQLTEYNARLAATAAQNEQLQREIAQLRAFIMSKGMKEDEGCAQQAGSGCAEAPASAAASSESLPVNRTSLGHIGSNPSGRDMATSLDAGAFCNGMQSAFAAASSAAPRDGVRSAMLQMADMPLAGARAASRGASGLLLCLGSAASIDQLLPPMDPLGMSLNDFLLGEAC